MAYRRLIERKNHLTSPSLFNLLYFRVLNPLVKQLHARTMYYSGLKKREKARKKGENENET